MKKLIIKIAFLSVIVTISHVLIIMVKPVNHIHYLAAIIDKHEILERAETPQIIFVGGSNLAFSLDSELIQNEFDLPVTNMGLHGGLGLKYMLNEIKYEIDSGDTIIVMPEYQHFDKTASNGESILGRMWEVYPESIRHMSSFAQIAPILESHPRVLRKSMYDLLLLFKDGTPIQRCENDIYCRDGFNSFGDVVGNQGNLFEAQSWEKSVVISQQTVDVIAELNDFNTFANSRGASVYFLFPGIPESIVDSDEGGCMDLYELLVDSLHIEILNQPSNSVYPHTFFYDTEYHMNDDGRNVRTQDVITWLSPVFE